jgi:hypothetical protein
MLWLIGCEEAPLELVDWSSMFRSNTFSQSAHLCFMYIMSWVTYLHIRNLGAEIFGSIPTKLRIANIFKFVERGATSHQ